MELKGIKEFLERYKKTILRGDITRGEVILCIKNISGVELKNNDFKIEKGVITLITSPIKKNQIFIYKEQILSVIKKNTDDHIFDIR